MTERTTPLFELAAAAGIEPGFNDIFGTFYPLSSDTAVAILAALGLPAGNEVQQRESLAKLREQPWRRGLARSLVVPAENRSATVPLHVPADLAVADWRIEEEAGGTHFGRIDLYACAVEEHCDIDGRVMARRAAVVSVDLPEGYHRLTVKADDRRFECMLIVAPRLCWQPEDAAPGRRLWGVACQLYSLRGQRRTGIGSYGDLAELTGLAAASGADIVGLNPLHALNPSDPDSHSPYSPASRDFLNIVYIDPFAVPEVAASPDVLAMLSDENLSDLADLDLIDYRKVTDRLLAALRVAFRGWGRASAERKASFETFRTQGGTALEAFGRYMVLQADLSAIDPINLDCRRWPTGLSTSDGPDVDPYADLHADEITFQIWLQWLADGQLEAVARQANRSGMAVGLYRDLAVGVGPASAAAWATPDRFVTGFAVGAPPDLLNRLGQNWGLMPFDPLSLAETGYAAWIDALRANMRHAGALRIDHAMALQHGYWVPDGIGAADGAYVTFPFDDLLRILALESRRNKCLVIGEDLGTVPPGFRDIMAQSGVLSYRVLMFERVGDDQLFARPDSYPESALVTFGTHDLPTLAGFWTGTDLQIRRDYALYPSDAARDADASGRITDRRRLIDALIDAGMWPADPPTDSETLPISPALAKAVQRFLALTPSRLMMVQLEDLLLLRDMMNLPGTVLEHPNWRRRLPVATADLFSKSEVTDQLAAINAMRRSPPNANDYH